MRSSFLAFLLLRRTPACLAAALAVLVTGHAAAWAQDASISTLTYASQLDGAANTIWAETDANSDGGPITGLYTVYAQNGKRLGRGVVEDGGFVGGKSREGENAKIPLDADPGHYENATVEYGGDCTYGASRSSATNIHIPPSSAAEPGVRRPSKNQPTRSQRERANSTIFTATSLTGPVTDGNTFVAEAIVYFSDQVSSKNAGQVEFRADGMRLGKADVTLLPGWQTGRAVFRMTPSSALQGKTRLEAWRLPTDTTTGSSSCVNLRH